MKRISWALKIFGAILTILLFAMPLFSCAHADETAKTVTVVVYGETPFSVTQTTNSAYLSELLEELSEQNKLTYSVENGAYGAFLASVADLDPEKTPQGDYIAVLSTDTDPKTTDSEYNSYTEIIEYDGKKFLSAIVGITSLTLKDGESYMFALVEYR